MSKHTTTHRRKAAAVGLALVGLAGFSLASAATLGLDAGDHDLVQAGTEDLTASSCQDGDIAVDFTLAGVTPGTLATGANFGYAGSPDAVRLTGINATDCATKQIRVALADEDGVVLGQTTTGTVTAGSVTLSLAAGGPFGASAVDTDDIGQISVTIFD